MIKPFLAGLCLAALTAHAAVINIDNAELTRLVASGVPLVDIRTADEWKDSGVIAGSRLLTFYDQNGRADPPPWLEKVKSLAKPDQPIILICRNRTRTRAATQFLSEQAGYKTVYNVSKGLNAWTGEGRPTVPATTSMAVCSPGTRC